MVPGVVHGLGTRALGTHRRWRSPRTAATDGTSRARSRFGGASHRPRRRGTTAAPSRLQPPKTGPAGRGRAAADSAIQRITFLAHRWAGLVRGWSECTRRYPGYHRGEGPKRTRPSFQFLPCQFLQVCNARLCVLYHVSGPAGKRKPTYLGQDRGVVLTASVNTRPKIPQCREGTQRRAGFLSKTLTKPYLNTESGLVRLGRQKNNF